MIRVLLKRHYVFILYFLPHVVINVFCYIFCENAFQVSPREIIGKRAMVGNVIPQSDECRFSMGIPGTICMSKEISVKYILHHTLFPTRINYSIKYCVEAIHYLWHFIFTKVGRYSTLDCLPESSPVTSYYCLLLSYGRPCQFLK